MAVDFPNSPSTGTVFIAADRAWSWNGVYWESISLDIGYTGSQGAGFTGSEGYVGSIGLTGSQGPIGYTGSQGFTGSEGFIGSAGYTGSQGYTGSEGPRALTRIFTATTVTLVSSLIPVSGTSTDYGVYTTGTLASVQTFGDYAQADGYWSAQDSLTTPALVVYAAFSNVDRFNRITAEVKYTVTNDAELEFDLYNFQTQIWDNFATHRGLEEFSSITPGVISHIPYIDTVTNTGTVYMKIHHNSTGTVGHELQIDYLAIEDAVAGPQGLKGDRGYSGSFGYSGSLGYVGSLGYTGSAGFTGSEGYIGSEGYTGSLGYTGSQGYTGSSGFVGSEGYTGSLGYIGSQGYTGSQGYIGSQGYTGSQGNPGDRSGVKYLFNTATNDTSMASGTLRYNNAVVANATQVYVHRTALDNNDYIDFFTSFTATMALLKGFLTLTRNDTQGAQHIFSVTTVTNNSTYFTLDVSFLAGDSANFVYGDIAILGFVRSGATGYTGSEGLPGSAVGQGWTGSSGAGFVGSPGLGIQGFSGSQAYTGSQGYIGSEGYSGSLGYSGSQGFIGSQGYVGSPGQGPMGYTGSPGTGGGGGGGGSAILDKHYNYPGALAPSAGTARWYSMGTTDVSRTTARVTTAPTGASLSLRIRKNGVSLFLLNISAGSYEAETTTAINMVEDDYITVDIVSVGTGASGSDLVVSFLYTRA